MSAFFNGYSRCCRWCSRAAANAYIWIYQILIQPSWRPLLLTGMVFCVAFAGTMSLAKEKVVLSKNSYNVILIVVNVLRADHLGCYGYHRETSPAIDALAEESFLFKNAFTQSDYTMPNMASIVTSLYPVSHGVYDAYKDQLPSRVYTMAEVMRLHKYRTAWFSVLHLPHLDIDIGFGRGFDDKIELSENFDGVDQLLEWIKGHKDDPFFVAINSRAMHAPYFPLPKYKHKFKKGEKGSIIDNREEFNKAWYHNIINLVNTPGSDLFNVYSEEDLANNKALFNGVYQEEKLKSLRDLMPPEKRHRFGYVNVVTTNTMVDMTNYKNMMYWISLYDACILGVDQELIKPVISALKRFEIYENTLIIITGDHGESLGEHHFLGHNHKFYDEQIHVPLIIKLPKIHKHKKIDGLVQSIDLMPTVFELLSIKIPYTVQGSSLLPLMLKNSHETINEYVYGYKRGEGYLRSLEWKLVVDLTKIDQENCNADKLFDLKNDPQELFDLNPKSKEIYKKLRKKFRAHLNSLPFYVDKEHTFSADVDQETRERIKSTGYW